MKKRLLNIRFFRALLVLTALYKYFLGPDNGTLQFCIEQLSLSFVDTLEFKVLDNTE